MIKKRRAFIVGIKSLKLLKNEIDFLKKYKPWGVILFLRNIKSIKQTKILTDNIKIDLLTKKANMYMNKEADKVNLIQK